MKLSGRLICQAHPCIVVVVVQVVDDCDKDHYASWLVKICWLGGTHSDADAAMQHAGQHQSGVLSVEKSKTAAPVRSMSWFKQGSTQRLLSEAFRGTDHGQKVETTGDTPQEQN